MDLDWKGGAAAAQQWMKGLARMDAKTAGRQLIDALGQGVRLQLTPRERLETLEALAPLVSRQLAETAKRLQEIHFPLDERTRRAAKDFDAICLGLITAYQGVLQQLHDATRSGQQAPAGLWQTLTHRILFFTLTLVRNRSRLDQRPPRQLWLRIHRLYLLARKGKQSDRVIDLPGFTDYATGSIESLYKQTLLLSLVPLHGLRPGQVEELGSTLGFWARDLELKVCREGMDREVMPFQIDPMADKPPLPADEDCSRCRSGRCVLLDMGKLVSRLVRLSERAHEARQERIELTRELQVSLTTLETLRHFWRQRPERSDRRDAGDANVDVVFSLRGIHKALGSGPEAEMATAETAVAGPAEEDSGMGFLLAEDSPFGDVPAPEATAPESEFDDVLDLTPSGLSFSLEGFDESEATPEEFAPGAGFEPAAPLRELEPTQPLDPWKERDDLSERFFSTEVKDRSQYGYQLEIALPGALKLRVGDIIGVRDAEAESPTVCVVRWIRESEDLRLIFGVERIAESPAPVHLDIKKGQITSRDLPALVGLHPRSAKTLLVIPYLEDARNQSLAVEYRGREIPIALAGMPQEYSQTFEAYEFGIRKADELVPDPNVPLITLEILEGLAKDAPAVGA